MIQQCNFRTTIEIFLQNRIILLSHDLEHHLLKPLVYFNNAKCGHYPRHPDKKRLLNSISFLFSTQNELPTILSYAFLRLALLGYFFCKKNLTSAPMHQNIFDLL
jgi:hypothetical protein